MSKENQRFHIFVSWKNSREATKIHEELGEQALTLRTVRHWIAKFKGDETDIQDKPRSGWPHEAVTPENIAKGKELVSNDPILLHDVWRLKLVFLKQELFTF